MIKLNYMKFHKIKHNYMKMKLNRHKFMMRILIFSRTNFQ